MRLACAKHLREVTERQHDPRFPYRFDEGLASQAILFFPALLRLEDGRRFRLTDWQKFVTGSIFGWVRKQPLRGKWIRRFQHAYIETGKGSGKTPWLAGTGLYGLVGLNERAAEIYIAATQREQAQIMMRDAIRMATDSDELSAKIRIGKTNLAVVETYSFMRTVSREHKGLDGPRPFMVLVDELHEHRDAMVVDKLHAGFKNRIDPMEIDITNAGHDQTSICWEHHQHSLDVLGGVIEDDTWFSYVCQLDPCTACYDQGYRQPRDGCSDCDSWTDEAVWKKTNPSLGVTIRPDYLQAQVDKAQMIPSKQSLVKRLNFCIWTESHEVWIPADHWAACKQDQVAEANPDRLPCAAGLDLSSKLDLTALVIALRYDDPPEVQPERITLETVDEDAEPVRQELTLNFSVEFIPFFWLPAETLNERDRTERIPYKHWKERGHLRQTLGATIDYDVIYQAIAKDLKKRYRIRSLGYDPNNATQIVTQLRDRARLKVVEMGQGRALSEAYKLLEVLIRSRRARHDGNLCLAWCFANASPKVDKYENLWIEKPAGNKRIDGAVAAAMALKELMVQPAKRGRGVRVSVVTAGGVRDLTREAPKEDDRDDNEA